MLILTTGGIFYTQLQSGFKVETNILKLLPKTETDLFAERAFERFSNDNFKKIIIAIGSPKQEEAIHSAKTFSQQLGKLDSVGAFSTQLSTDEQKAIGKLYFNHRFHLLSESDKDLLKSAGKEPFIDDSLQLIYSPLAGKLTSLIPDDPYLLSYRYLNNSAISTSSNHQFIDGMMTFRQKDQTFALLSVTLQNSPFDSSTQQDVIQALNRFESAHPQLTLLRTGALFYAQHGVASAKSEISTIGLGSLIAVIVLIILAFRSSLPLLLTLTSLGVGVFAAFTFVHFIYGSIHVLTLVFGSSLVGVAVDYAFHYFASANTSKTPLKSILSAITMGLISSVIGYIALYSAPFPGLQQMALFCSIGLIGAFLTVVLLFDRIDVKVSTPTFLIELFRHHRNISQKFATTPLIIALLIFPLIAGYYLINTDNNNDSIRQLQATPPDLYQQEQKITQLIAAPATNQFFVVKGKTTEQVLATLDSFKPELQQLVDDHAIQGFTALTQFVPSEQQQNANYHLIKNRLMDGDYEQLGLLSPQQITELQQTFVKHADNALKLQSWLDSPLGQRFGYLWLGKIDNTFASIITVKNIKDLNALEATAEAHNNLYFINKVDKVSSMFASYRVLALTMLAVAAAFIFTILSFKYRLRIASYIMLPPFIAASIAIIVNVLINGSFNLFNTLALFLVFGIGIDYGLFYAESKSRSLFINLAIGLSAFTTLLSFGLLALSETPAIHAFGLTMLSGILTVFLLSPLLGHKIYQASEGNHD